MNLPKDYQSKMQEMLGEEYLQYLDSFHHSYGQTLRVNQLKMEPADFIRRFLLSGQVSWCNTGFYYEGEQKLSAHPYYYAGVYYLQEPSAMAPAAFLPVEPGDRVLDLCAAPGESLRHLRQSFREKEFCYRMISVLPGVSRSLKIWRWQAFRMR